MATSNGILARLFAAKRLTRVGRLVAGRLRQACALVRRILRHGPARADGADREPTAVDGHPVAVRQGDVLAVAFHPELSGDGRLHAWLLDAVAARATRTAA